MTHYVNGFMFNEFLDSIALICKKRPSWQYNLYNGVGGKREDGEQSIDAMVREFREETGLQTNPSQWKHFCQMSGKNTDTERSDFLIDFYATIGNLGQLKSMTDEPVEIFGMHEISEWSSSMLENLPWLIYLAHDHLKDGRPHFATINYV